MRAAIVALLVAASGLGATAAYAKVPVKIIDRGQELAAGYSLDYVLSMYVTDTEDLYFLAQTTDLTQQAFVRSKNGTISRLSTPFDNSTFGIRQLAVSPSAAYILAGGNDGRVYRRDGSGTWTLVLAPGQTLHDPSTPLNDNVYNYIMAASINDTGDFVFGSVCQPLTSVFTTIPTDANSSFGRFLADGTYEALATAGGQPMEPGLYANNPGASTAVIDADGNAYTVMTLVAVGPTGRPITASGLLTYKFPASLAAPIQIAAMPGEGITTAAGFYRERTIYDSLSTPTSTDYELVSDALVFLVHSQPYVNTSIVSPAYPVGTVIGFNRFAINAAGKMYAFGSYITGAPFNSGFGYTYPASAAVYSLIDSPEQLIAQLASDVMALNMKRGIANALDAKLDAAIASLVAANADQRANAVNQLMAFINAVMAQSGKEISSVEANSLISRTQDILSLL